MSFDINKYINKKPKSYWIASTPDTDYPKLNKDLKIDVAIIGGGIAGISCAYFLKKEGINVAVFEADHIIHGTTGHTTAKITSQHYLIYDKIKSQISLEMAKQYAESNEVAIKAIEKTINERNIDCDFTKESSYIYTQENKYVKDISNEVSTASDAGIKAVYLDEIPLPLKAKAAVRFDDQAQFHPRKYLLALAKEIPDNDNFIFEQSRIIDIEENQGKYILTSENGFKVISDRVIIASHYPCYNKAGLYFSRIYADRSYVVAIKSLNRYPGGMYISAEDPGRSLRAQDTESGELIFVGGDHHKTGQGEDTLNHYKALMEFSDEIFGIEDIPYMWSTQDCMTNDGIPYIGHFSSDNPNLYIATGFNKWGMTGSTVAAMVIKDMIVKGESPWQDVYNPLRKTIKASAKSFIAQNLDVAGELIKGKIIPASKKVDVKTNEGKIVNIDGKRCGAYRDENGKLFVVDTTCTHLGCELNFNSAEKTWDCPCHGSRFSYDGKIVEGPAIKKLKLYDI